MTRRTWMVAGLLFGSGFSALVYQTVWLREFRMIFGASTGATAAVLAIFMAGLGIGSAVLGKRADARSSPLGFYAHLELLIALSAALSLPLLWLVRTAYLASGGSVHLGMGIATVIRLLLSMLVLAIPTFLMGGTLPAAARAVETAGDESRRNLALLYGMNTIGAVAGTLLSTFFLLENLGNEQTLFVAALLNALVAITARGIAKRIAAEEAPSPYPLPQAGEGHRPAELPPRVVLIAAAVFGFAFLLMELVWYRMLGPILGGTTFTFGLILAIALLGIGLGGALYSAWNRATPGALAVTAALEALAIIVPFVIGDHLALYSNLLRTLGHAGFQGYVIAWSVITGIIVFPAALVAGFQFPLLIALLGRGREDVGRHVGQAYAWNTAGAIAGSLAGGFGILPLLSAPGAWRFVTIALAVVAVVISIVAMRVNRQSAIASIAIAIVSIASTFAAGPTSLWRHSGIGAGRLKAAENPNDARNQAHRYRRLLLWDADGRESSVGLMGGDDISFIVNGKSDGSARGDSGTQVMGGMIGAFLHPNPRTAFVIGLGTGSTAGWLASVPTMQRVDVGELEPIVLRVAEECAAVNQNVMKQKNVNVAIADARELLLAGRGTYDIIFSEPSNPYRAGIASLFTKEFYSAASKRLSRDGIFLQWVQAYDIDAATLRTIYGTLLTTFAHVDTFWTTRGDLVLVATRQPLTYDIDAIRRKMLQPGYGPAIHNAWRVESAEGFLSHFVANEKIARALGSQAYELNTDDRTVIEFGFARGLDGRSAVIAPLAEYSKKNDGMRPTRIRGNVDWNLVELNRAAELVLPFADENDETLKAHRQFAFLADKGDMEPAARTWVDYSLNPANTAEIAAAGEALAEMGDSRAMSYANTLARFQPAESDAIAGRLAFKEKRYADATKLLLRSITRARNNPWGDVDIIRRGLEVSIAVARAYPESANQFYDALKVPFVTGQLDQVRKTAMLTIASGKEECGPRVVETLKMFEPYPPWNREHLQLRAACYARATLPTLSAQAQRDYREFIDAEPEPLGR